VRAAIEAIIHRQPPSLLQYVLLSLLLVSLIIDGLDMQLLSLVSPLLLLEWKLPKGDLGPAMSAALVGMSVGAMAGGWLGDRWGRKSVLGWSVLCFGIATICVAYSRTPAHVTLLRLAGGVGFGAAGPNAVTLASEWLCGAVRMRAIGLMSVGTPLGGMVGAIVLISELSTLGWRGSFLLCGATSVLAAFMIFAVVPESPSYLLDRGRIKQVARLTKRWTGARIDIGSLPLDGGEQFNGVVSAPTVRFRVTRRLIWGNGLTFFSASFVAYACVAWIPVALTMNGIPLERGIRSVFWLNLFAVTSAVLAGHMVRTMGSQRLMAMGAFVAAAAVILLAASVGPLWILPSSPLDGFLEGAAGAVGGGTGAVLSTVYMVIAAGYPVGKRSGGLGLGMMLGRTGGIVSTYFGGYLLGAAPANSAPFFIALMLGAISTFVGIHLVDRHLVASTEKAR
jgi:MFS transporter, AAHS family, 4-hydroxybenzoate transporter